MRTNEAAYSADRQELWTFFNRQRVYCSQIKQMTSAIRLIPIIPRVFLTGLAVRWTYALLLYGFLGGGGLKGEDSITYSAAAE
jgi:hypothetical protein